MDTLDIHIHVRIFVNIQISTKIFVDHKNRLMSSGFQQKLTNLNKIL